ncbi:MAG: transcriptional regulator [Anaerolineaceae bacterium]|jgi:DNA-binding transcriptional regulator of glucitol operon|nr:MAG: transcriptional regulator [Anaerolineaceae bacterium]
MELGSTLIIGFVIAWIIQFAMTFLQMRRFNKRLTELRRLGTTAVGMSGSMYKRRTYGVLVINKDEKILHAEQFSGWTVFASLKPVKELEGLTTKDIMDESMELPVSKKTRNAFQNAVQQIENAKKKAAEQQAQVKNERMPESLPGDLKN